MKKQAKADWSDLTALDGRSGQEALRILEELKVRDRLKTNMMLNVTIAINRRPKVLK